MSGPLFVLGASGHARVVIDTARRAGWAVEGLYDDDPALAGTEVLGVPVLGPIEALAPDRGAVVFGIGANRVRQRLAEALAARHGEALRWAAVVHPAAVVADSARVAPGAVVFAGAVVQPQAEIGPHAIVNTSASVDHDARLEAFVHVAPGVRLAGAVVVEEGAFVGIGAAVIPGRRIGAWAAVGAGAVVTRDLAAGGTYVGVPARRIG